MKYFSIIFLAIFWIMIIIFDYYELSYFISPFLWLSVVLILVIYSIVQIFKLVKEKIKRPIVRIVKLSFSFLLLFLTIYGFYGLPRMLIEKIDWKVYKNERTKIVNDVKRGKLIPNVNYNSQLCSLGTKYNNVSNGGNEILISHNNGTTVKFWISRGFFESPQSYFIYTNDESNKKYYQDLIEKEPEYNWKIEDNWFRILERN